MRINQPSIALLIAIYVGGGQLNAEPVSYLQPPLAEDIGLRSGPPTEPPEAPVEQRADNFSFAQTTKVTTVRWWGTYLNNPPSGSDLFKVRFFEPDLSAGGVPQQIPTNQYTSLAIARSNSGLFDSLGDPIYEYEAQLPAPVIFTAGAFRYFSVLNQSSNPWYWQRSSDAGSNWFRLDEEPDSAWFPASGIENVGNLAFQMIGVTPPQGDYNSDFAVNHTDYSQWKSSFGSSSAPLATDGNLNGVVDAADYVVWRKNFGTTSGSSSLTVVPEPSSRMLTVSVAMLLAVTVRARATFVAQRYVCFPDCRGIRSVLSPPNTAKAQSFGRSPRAASACFSGAATRSGQIVDPDISIS
jgi:hypothetical protein